MLNKDADGNRMVYSNELAKVAVGDTIVMVANIKRTQRRNRCKVQRDLIFQKIKEW